LFNPSLDSNVTAETTTPDPSLSSPRRFAGGERRGAIMFVFGLIEVARALASMSHSPEISDLNQKVLIFDSEEVSSFMQID